MIIARGINWQQTDTQTNKKKYSIGEHLSDSFENTKITTRNPLQPSKYGKSISRPMCESISQSHVLSISTW